ncbi:MAG: IS4 family transposase [Deltaproteobacteria bacterium]|nr:IS4 family transposase [Deltaproteobacteria bacterium]
MAEVMDALAELGPRGVARFQESVDPAWVDEALRATGTASIRRRRFPAEQAVWLIIGAGLFADRSIQEIAEHLGLVVPGTPRVAPSAVSKARYRIGERPLEWLFHRVADAWACSPGLSGYRGLALFGVDGSHLRVPDSDDNFEHFGKPGGRGGSGDAGYPQLRLCALMSLDTRLLVDARFGPWSTGEQDLATELWPAVPDKSLTILDRGFVNYRVFARLVASGIDRHVMVRMRADMKYDRVEVLPDGTEIALLRPCSEAIRQEPDIAPSMTVRIIHYQHQGGIPSRLCVTLLDPALYPAKELIQLYHDRWEIEIAYDELKTHMLHRKESLRSKKPEGVEQEVWGLLLAYNLVRREMLLVAAKNNVPPKRISFWTSLLRIRDFWIYAATTSAPGNIPARLADMEADLRTLVLPPRRSKRRYPRHVKIKMSNYPRNRGKRSPPAAGDLK